MIVRVPVSNELLCQMLTTGYALRGVHEVTQGIAAGSVLTGVSMGAGLVNLIFRSPGPDDGAAAVQDLPIIIQSNREEFELACEIALESSESLIESCSREIDVNGEKWLEIGEEYLPNVSPELRYLELRGELTRHASSPWLVRMKDYIFDDDPEVSAEVQP